jgi:hypothetical protein
MLSSILPAMALFMQHPAGTTAESLMHQRFWSATNSVQTRSSEQQTVV